MLKSIIFSEQSDHCSKEIKDKTKSNDFYSQFPLRGSPAWHLTPGAEMVSLFPVMDSLSSNLLASLFGVLSVKADRWVKMNVCTNSRTRQIKYYQRLNHLQIKPDEGRLLFADFWFTLLFGSQNCSVSSTKSCNMSCPSFSADCSGLVFSIII